MRNRIPRLLILSLLLLLLPVVSSAQPLDSSGATGVWTPNTPTVTGVLDSEGDSVTLALEGRAGAGVYVDSPDLEAAVVASVSIDGGVTWDEASFYTSFTSEAWSTPGGGGYPYLALGGAAFEQQVGILLIGGATHVRVTCTGYIGGSATVTLRASNAHGRQPFYMSDMTFGSIFGAPQDNYYPTVGLMAPGNFTPVTIGANGAGGGRLNTTIEGVAGGLISTGIGVADAGTLRVVLASDQPTVAVDTELPAAAALADNSANPTAPAVGAFTLYWDGATWDRWTGAVTANAGTNLNTSALALEATQADNRTALQIIDDWDETDRAKVNPIVGQAGVAAGSGAVSAATQRVVLPTDQPSFATAAANNTGSQVALTTASATILASFATRKGASICSHANNTDVIFIKWGATATTSNFRMEIGQCWNSPAGWVYTGVIDGRANTGTQTVSVMEY